MAFDKFLEFFQFKDEDDDYYDSEDDMAEEEKVSSKPQVKSQVQPAATSRPVRSTQTQEVPAAARTATRERSLGNNNKVVPITKVPRSFEVSVLKPSNINDAMEACDMLLSGRATVVNLEGQDPVEAQRIIDFVSGCLYAINGRLNKISRYIFIFSPENVDISGDLEDLIKNDGSFSAPTINKEF